LANIPAKADLSLNTSKQLGLSLFNQSVNQSLHWLTCNILLLLLRKSNSTQIKSNLFFSSIK